MYVLLAILTIVYLLGLRGRVRKQMPIFPHFLDYSAFAMIILKLGSEIDWSWVVVLAPILAQTMHRYLEYVVTVVEALAIKASGSEEAGVRFCDRHKKRLQQRHEKQIRALEEMRRLFAYY